MDTNTFFYILGATKRRENVKLAIRQMRCITILRKKTEFLIKHRQGNEKNTHNFIKRGKSLQAENVRFIVLQLPEKLKVKIYELFLVQPEKLKLQMQGVYCLLNSSKKNHLANHKLTSKEYFRLVAKHYEVNKQSLRTLLSVWYFQIEKVLCVL